MNRHGLSLLEVILATAILLAATVTLARLAFVTTQHAQRAEDRSTAIEIAEFQMQQLLLGQLPLQTTAPGPVLEEVATLGTDSAVSHPWDQWQYAIQVQATQLPQVYRVQVDVFRLPPAETGNNLPSMASDNLANNSPAAGNNDQVLFQYSVVRLLNVGD